MIFVIDGYLGIDKRKLTVLFEQKETVLLPPSLNPPFYGAQILKRRNT